MGNSEMRQLMADGNDGRDYRTLSRDACRRAQSWILTAGRRMGQADVVEDLGDLLALKIDVEFAIQRAITDLKAQGATWAEIGRATGTTGQAATMKWGQRKIKAPPRLNPLSTTANEGDAPCGCTPERKQETAR